MKIGEIINSDYENEDYDISMASFMNHHKKRKKYTPEEVEYLESKFQEDPLPDSDTREQMALKLNRDKRSIQIWFQNKRAKLKTSQISNGVVFKQYRAPTGSSNEIVHDSMFQMKSNFEEQRILNMNFFSCIKCSFGSSEIVNDSIYCFIDTFKKEINIEFSNMKRIEFDYFDVSNLAITMSDHLYHLNIELFRFPRYSMISNQGEEWRTISDLPPNEQSKLIILSMPRNQLILLVNKMKRVHQRFQSFINKEF
jgi:hypothetical protein